MYWLHSRDFDLLQQEKINNSNKGSIPLSIPLTVTVNQHDNRFSWEWNMTVYTSECPAMAFCCVNSPL